MDPSSHRPFLGGFPTCGTLIQVCGPPTLLPGRAPPLVTAPRPSARRDRGRRHAAAAVPQRGIAHLAPDHARRRHHSTVDLPPLRERRCHLACRRRRGVRRSQDYTSRCRGATPWGQRRFRRSHAFTSRSRTSTPSSTGSCSAAPRTPLCAATVHPRDPSAKLGLPLGSTARASVYRPTSDFNSS